MNSISFGYATNSFFFFLIKVLITFILSIFSLIWKLSSLLKKKGILGHSQKKLNSFLVMTCIFFYKIPTYTYELPFIYVQILLNINSSG